MVTKFSKKFAIIMLKTHRKFCRGGLAHLAATPTFQKSFRSFWFTLYDFMTLFWFLIHYCANIWFTNSAVLNLLCTNRLMKFCMHFILRLYQIIRKYVINWQVSNLKRKIVLLAKNTLMFSKKPDFMLNLPIPAHKWRILLATKQYMYHQGNLKKNRARNVSSSKFMRNFRK